MFNGSCEQVEKIMDQRRRGRQTEYLVKWTGFPETACTWEPARNVSSAPEALDLFLKERAGTNQVITHKIRHIARPCRVAQLVRRQCVYLGVLCSSSHKADLCLGQ